MVGILLSYWDGLFSGAMLVLGGVHHLGFVGSMKSSLLMRIRITMSRDAIGNQKHLGTNVGT